ncbi:hypothetical protein GNE08_28030 (plasmid) [Trichormus variabilis ARAD]|nr:hypothetical protein [Trichormus variabilis]MBC1218039.1 hypothetical protein [Trichormus variabilis ARAD]MBC1259286.1 hypothetical protein [Trichormus variabilis V5]MBC1270783.1 hypothetical protein [Trichormus variabilis FSR]MBC1305686.1 hypothetical protein [Trichormus variabilis N2B]MBC1329749.1 hypothetical protein [Trichormus variabilis 9RC]MBD2382515.1 hypothetical protein [Trichormus variabilis FACHB-319]QFZ15186.1 hypothetical protein EH233_26040 [Anabaena sp. YBS01]QHD83678.1 h
MSRTKRWINMNGKEFNSDGTLKPEARLQMLSEGMSEGAIDDYAQRLKEEFQEWKNLDETDPEEWIEYTAYDFFTEEEKRQFNPDGSLKPQYRESELARGTSEDWLKEMERRKKLEVDSYNQLSAKYADKGINFGAWQMRSRVNASRTYLERREQMEIDLRNCEEPSSLPFDPNTPW